MRTASQGRVFVCQVICSTNKMQTKWTEWMEFLFLRVWVWLAGDGVERGAGRRFARTPTHPHVRTCLRVRTYMRDPLRLFPSSPFAGDLSPKDPSLLKRGSKFLGNTPILEVVPAFALLPESSRRRSSRPDSRCHGTIARCFVRCSCSLPSWSSPSLPSASPQSHAQREKWPCRR